MLRYKLRLLSEEVKEYECFVATDTVAVRNFLLDKMRVQEEPEEVILVLFVGTNGQVNGYSEVARGLVEKCYFSNREIIKRALLANCGRIIIVHNHPGGTPSFSRDDIEATKELESACKLMQIHLLDHCLVAGNRVISAVERGIL